MSTSVSNMQGAARLAHVVALVLLAAGGFALARRLQAPDATLLPAAGPAAPAAQAQPSSPPLRALPAQRPQRLTVALRLDPTLTQGMFMGDRWVSPADFHFAQAGTVFVVQAKAQHSDGQGERHDFVGNWNATNPRMIDVQRNLQPDARAITLAIRQPGDSDVTVSAGGETVVLHVHAVQLADSIQVHIRQ